MENRSGDVVRAVGCVGGMMLDVVQTAIFGTLTGSFRPIHKEPSSLHDFAHKAGDRRRACLTGLKPRFALATWSGGNGRYPVRARTWSACSGLLESADSLNSRRSSAKRSFPPG